MRLNDATPADWDRLRKAHPAVDRDMSIVNATREANERAAAAFNRWSPEEPKGLRDEPVVQTYNANQDAWKAGAEEEAAALALQDLDWSFEEEDVVNNPEHYNTGNIECIAAIEESMSAEAFKGYLKGNTMKYLWRYDYKGKQVEDLKKARWYMDRLTAVVVEENK
jgi:hypothetical protein